MTSAVESEFGKESVNFLNSEAKIKDWNIAAIASISLKGVTSQKEADKLDSISLCVSQKSATTSQHHDLLRCVLVKEKYREKDSTVVFSIAKRPFPLLAVPASSTEPLYWETASSLQHSRSGESSPFVFYNSVGKASVPNAPLAPGSDQTVTAWTAKMSLSKKLPSSEEEFNTSSASANGIGSMRARRNSSYSLAALNRSQQQSSSSSSWSVHVHLRIRRLLPLAFVYELEPPQADYIAICTMVAVSHVPFHSHQYHRRNQAKISVTRQRARLDGNDTEIDIENEEAAMNQTSIIKENNNNNKQTHHHQDPSSFISSHQDEEDLNLVSSLRGTVRDLQQQQFSPMSSSSNNNDGSSTSSRRRNRQQQKTTENEQETDENGNSNSNDRETIGVWGGMRGRWVYSYTDEDDVEDVLRFSIREDCARDEENELLNAQTRAQEEVAIGKMTLGELATDVLSPSNAYGGKGEEDYDENENEEDEAIKKVGKPSPQSGNSMHDRKNKKKKMMSPPREDEEEVENDNKDDSPFTPRENNLGDGESPSLTTMQQSSSSSSYARKHSNRILKQQRQKASSSSANNNNAEDESNDNPIPELLLVVRNGALWPPLLLASEQQQQKIVSPIKDPETPPRSGNSTNRKEKIISSSPTPHPRDQQPVPIVTDKDSNNHEHELLRKNSPSRNLLLAPNNNHHGGYSPDNGMETSRSFNNGDLASDNLGPAPTPKMGNSGVFSNKTPKGALATPRSASGGGGGGSKTPKKRVSICIDGETIETPRRDGAPEEPPRIEGTKVGDKMYQPHEMVANADDEENQNDEDYDNDHQEQDDDDVSRTPPLASPPKTKPKTPVKKPPLRVVDPSKAKKNPEKKKSMFEVMCGCCVSAKEEAE